MRDAKTVLLITPARTLASHSMSELTTQSILQQIEGSLTIWRLSVDVTAFPLNRSSLLFNEAERHITWQVFGQSDHAQSAAEALFNAEFFNLLHRLNPAIVHWVDPHELGLASVWAVKRELPASQRYASFSDASGLCALNGLLLNHRGEWCDGPSLAKCRNCCVHVSADDLLQQLSFTQNTYSVFHQCTVVNARYQQAFQKFGAKAMISRPDIPVRDHSPVNRTNDCTLTNFAYFGPVAGHDMRLLAETMKLTTVGSSLHVFPTDVEAPGFGEFIERYQSYPNIHLQPDWDAGRFTAYLNQIHAVVVPSKTNWTALQWLQPALDCGLNAILPADLPLIVEIPESQVTTFVHGSVLSLCEAMAEQTRGAPAADVLNIAANIQKDNCLSIRAMYAGEVA